MEREKMPEYALQLIKLAGMIAFGRQIRTGTSRWNVVDTVRLIAELKRKERMN